MKITCTSDLHGYYPALVGGDLLIIAGDLTLSDTPEQHIEFCEWLDMQLYLNKIVVAGNHDNNIDRDAIGSLKGCYYLEDSGIEIQGLKIWGTPWSREFRGMNRHCKAFTYADEAWFYDEKVVSIPKDTDILVSHAPSCGVLDQNRNSTNCGSLAIHMCLKFLIRPRLHIFGHIHEGYGQEEYFSDCLSINCSHVDWDYMPVNVPVNI